MLFRSLILCRPLLLLPPDPPSIRDFSNESTLRMRWPKYWSFILLGCWASGHLRQALLGLKCPFFDNFFSVQLCHALKTRSMLTTPSPPPPILALNITVLFLIACLSALHSRLTRGVRPRLEGKPSTPLSCQVATGISWSSLCGLK